MIPTLQALLSAHPVFQTLPETQLAEFAGLARKRTYQAGEFLCLHGDLWPYLFLVAAGLIEIRKESPEGRSLLVASLRPGELFWGVTFFNEQAGMPVMLAANQDSQVYLWSRQQCLPFILQNGAFSWQLTCLMAQRMLLVSDIVEGLAFQPVANRLARLLLEEYPTNLVTAGRHMTLEEMAARIGTTREMVCRVLQRFANQDLIEITRTEFTFKDQEKLAQLARKDSA
ncbi:MAG: Crp/Fnr family transcriptional regulator [Anaerolineales bacterium]|nr:Crp/Fnr family transcriptional regulator [Anaerolineales bacterium]